jgi:hypothetical protein
VGQEDDFFSAMGSEFSGKELIVCRVASDNTLRGDVVNLGVLKDVVLGREEAKTGMGKVFGDGEVV